MNAQQTGCCAECGVACGAGQQVHAHVRRFCSTHCKNRAWRRLHRPGRTLGPVAMVPEGLETIVAQEGANAVQPAPGIAHAAIERCAELEQRVQRLEQLPRRSSGSDATKWLHGANCYRNHGCRCVICKEGANAAARARRARRATRLRQ